MKMIALPVVQDQRLQVCRACQWYDSLWIRCRHCGCFLKAKVKLKNQKCPIGKW